MIHFSLDSPQPKKLEIRKYQYVPKDERIGEKQGLKWDCFQKWKHLFEPSKKGFTLYSLDFTEAKKNLQEIRIAQSQTENKMRIWIDNNGVIKGI